MKLPRITNDPERFLSDDPGDDVQRRFRYQNTYCAILSLDLVSKSPSSKVLYCEHHDDLLVRRTDGSLIAVQVKTKITGPAWKPDDEPMASVIDRFVKLEVDSGSRFFRYTIASNHPFFKLHKRGTSFDYLIQSARSCTTLDDAGLDEKFVKYVQKVVKRTAATEPEVLSVLRKLFTDDRPPKLRDIGVRLREEIRNVRPEFTNVSVKNLDAAADSLIMRVTQAASLGHEETGQLFLGLADDPIARSEEFKIAGKRIVARDVEQILTDALNQPELLSSATLGNSPAFDFERLVRTLAEPLVGRKWVGQVIEEWLAAKDGPRILAIVGMPGSGKSTVAAGLVAGQLGKPPLAYHFCRVGRAATILAETVVPSLAAAIGRALSSYGVKLKTDELRQALSSAACARDPISSFEHGVLDQLRTLPSNGETFYLVFDAVNECDVDRGQVSVLDLITELAQSFPDWLRILVTTHSERSVLGRLERVSNLQEIELDKHESEKDVAAYIRRTLEASDNSEIRGLNENECRVLCDMLCDIAGTNFMVASECIAGILEGTYSLDDPLAIPRRLSGHYEANFRRRFPTDVEYHNARCVLATLLAAESPLSLAQLETAVVNDLEPVQPFPEVMHSIERFLHAEKGSVFIYHQTFIDWLTDDGHRFNIQSSDGAHRLIEMCWSEYLAGSGEMSWFSLRYLPELLLRSERSEEMTRLLLDYSFWEAKANAGLVVNLNRDFAAAIEFLHDGKHTHATLTLNAISAALTADIEFIAAYPDKLFQCIWNRCWWHDCEERDSHFERTYAMPPPLHERRFWSWWTQWRIVLGFLAALIVKALGLGQLLAIATQFSALFLPTKIEEYFLRLRTDAGFMFRRLRDRTSTTSMPPTNSRPVSSLMERWYEHRARNGSLSFLRSLRPPESSSATNVSVHYRCSAGNIVATCDANSALACASDSALNYLSERTGETLMSWDVDEPFGRVLGAAFCRNRSTAVLLVGSHLYGRLLYVFVYGQPEVLKLETQRRHTAAGLSLSVNPEADRAILSCINSPCISVVSLTGNANATISTDFEGIECSQISNDGKLVFYSPYSDYNRSPHEQILAYSVDEDKEVFRLVGHTSEVTCLKLLPGGDRLASSGRLDGVRVWDVESRSELFFFELGFKSVAVFASSANGRFLACGTTCGWIFVWDIVDGKEVDSTFVANRSVVSLSISNDAEAVHFAYERNNLVWKWARNSKDAESRTETLINHERQICAISSSSNGRVTVTQSAGGGVFVWDSARGIRVTEFQGDRSIEAAISGNGERVAFSRTRYKRRFRSWIEVRSVERGCLLRRFKMSPDALSLSERGDRLLVSIAQGIVELDVKTGRKRFEVPTKHGGYANHHLRYSPSMEYFVFWSNENSVDKFLEVRSANNGELICDLPCDGLRIENLEFIDGGSRVYASGWSRVELFRRRDLKSFEIEKGAEVRVIVADNRGKVQSQGVTYTWKNEDEMESIDVEGILSDCGDRVVSESVGVMTHWVWEAVSGTVLVRDAPKCESALVDFVTEPTADMQTVFKDNHQTEIGRYPLIPSLYPSHVGFRRLGKSEIWAGASHEHLVLLRLDMG